MQFFLVSGQRGSYDLPIGISLPSETFLPRDNLKIQINGESPHLATLAEMIGHLEMLWARTRPLPRNPLHIRPATQEHILWLNAIGTGHLPQHDPLVQSINHYRVDDSRRLSWFQKNPNGFSVMLRGDVPIGMIELLPLKPRLLAPLIESDDRFHESSLGPEHIAAPNELDSPEGFTHIYFENILIDPEERTQRLAIDLAIDHATDLLLRVDADVNRGMIYAYPVAPSLPTVGAFPYSQRRYAPP